MHATFVGLGAVTRVVRSDQITVSQCEALNPEAIVVSPGPKRPEEAGCSVDVIRELGVRIPTLGVCLGHQAIAIAFRGSCGAMPGDARASFADHA